MVKPQGNPRTDPRNEAASSLFEVHPQDSRHIEEHRRPIPSHSKGSNYKTNRRLIPRALPFRKYDR